MEVRFLIQTILMLIAQSIVFFVFTNLIEISPNSLLWASIGITITWAALMVWEADRDYANRHKGGK